ncbi:sulfurtransferase [Leptospira dzoumogneensis]|uniref:Thiosulfate sulfurtransferase n=1 Tax=Leptospira dzoumogneensis TaxID=2484904 RepID=A0A4Z1AP97_9LEPT|nr:rhodanese-like domain-containing protein [Leptospira dzoumogneensis]TGN03392.1 thiosulfate sulfurtransferase [Leptospira dzoumogneensis]
MKLIISFALVLFVSQSLLASEKLSGVRGWFISAPEALYLHGQGAVFVDAREGIKISSFSKAVPLGWQEISQKEFPNQGNLAQASEAKEVLRKKGLDGSKIVLVFGDPAGGWGEEGRIVWSLRTLGFSKSFIVDGGINALQKASTSPVPKRPEILSQVNSSTSENKGWSADSKLVQSELSDKKFAFIDTREEREFLGQTPYGESRGGHLPGAKWIYYKQFLDKDGYLLGESKILAKLYELGISKDKTVVSYCTGGVRSGWMTSVLVSLGYNAKNYAGSMWEWSSKGDQNHPLVIK